MAINNKSLHYETFVVCTKAELASIFTVPLHTEYHKFSSYGALAIVITRREKYKVLPAK
jgi:hypothetical protein